MKYLLDTNIISELIAKNPNEDVVRFITSLSEENVYLSVVTIGEICSGVEKLQDSDKKEKITKWLYEDLLKRFEYRIVNIDTDIMLLWGKINQRLRVAGQPLPIMDLLIAATCISKNLVLVTRNEKDFKNTDAKIINPFL